MSLRRFSVQLLSLSFLLSALVGCSISIPLYSGTRAETMELETLIPAKSSWTRDKVLLLSIDGEISAGEGSGGMLDDPSTLVYVMDVLRRAELNPSIKSVLLRINSPGGGVTASDLLYHELMEYKKRGGAKIEAIFMGLAASGGYYAAMAADHITALPTGVTGSIGVIAFFPSVEGLTRKVGVDVRVIKSGPRKDIGSLFRDMQPEERAILQGVVDQLQRRFLGVVEAGRPKLSPEKIRELADGRVFTAQEALENGLVDQVGYLSDAFGSAMRLANLTDASLVVYKYPGDYKGNYYAIQDTKEKSPLPAPNAAAQVNLLNVDLGRARRVVEPFHFLWLP
jgi:protease-4